MAVKVKMKPTSVIRSRVFGNGKAQQFFTNTCYKRMNKYVPNREQGLRTNTQVGSNYITYMSEYANYLYRGILYVDPKTGSSWARKDTTKVPTGISLQYSTPGTGSHWDKKMWTAEGKDATKELEKYIARGCK